VVQRPGGEDETVVQRPDDGDDTEPLVRPR
jgi:hypothetical protein